MTTMQVISSWGLFLAALFIGAAIARWVCDYLIPLDGDGDE